MGVAVRLNCLYATSFVDSRTARAYQWIDFLNLFVTLHRSLRWGLFYGTERNGTE